MNASAFGTVHPPELPQENNSGFQTKNPGNCKNAIPGTSNQK